MKIKNVILICAGITLFMTGCISKPLALSPVGPGPISRNEFSSKGFLQVFSATETIDVDFHAYFNPHTGYDIEDESGKVVQFVPNRASDMDEWPDQVTLPAGNYHIMAESTCCGLTSVPVLIQKGNTTVVHLDRNWWPPSNTPTNQLVYLPDGEVVGWSSSISKSSE